MFRGTDNSRREHKTLGKDWGGIDLGVDRNQLRAFVNKAVKLRVQTEAKS
jgi:hypothetical protein